MTLSHCLSRVGRSIGSAAAFVTAAVVLASIPEHSIRAQMLPAADAAILDPYTRGKEDRLADLGYVSLGPLQLTSNHDSDDVQRLLGDERLRWIETRNFRIGFALSAAEAAGSPAFVQGLRQDLAELRQRLPAVDPRTKVLDAWLRAHLVALRAERLYADALVVLRRSQGDFASAGRDPRADATFAGLGPHFGMQQKFTILLLGKQTSLAKYSAAFHGGATTAAARRHDASFGNLVFAVAGDSVPGLGENEEALAATMAFHVAHNLYAGYRSFGHLLPAWIPEGLALHHARRVSGTAAVVDVRNDADRAAYAAWPQRLVDAKKLRAARRVRAHRRRQPTLDGAGAAVVGLRRLAAARTRRRVRGLRAPHEGSLPRPAAVPHGRGTARAAGAALRRGVRLRRRRAGGVLAARHRLEERAEEAPLRRPGARRP
jgi:hypothetical protein